MHMQTASCHDVLDQCTMLCFLPSSLISFSSFTTLLSHYTAFCSCHWWLCLLLFAFFMNLTDLFQSSPTLSNVTIITLCSASVLCPSSSFCHLAQTLRSQRQMLEEDQDSWGMAMHGMGQGKQGCEMRVWPLSPSLPASRCCRGWCLE